MTHAESRILHQWPDGLVLRRAATADAERLAEFNGKLHGENPEDTRGVAAWTRDLLTLPHPTFQPEDFTLVEDPATGEVVSTLCTISQTWLYEQIPFGVGRPELVGTLPAYRNRGLIRAQFEVVHAWSRERGELVQAITGIPYYYRQYGYEMTLELSGGQVGYQPQVPALAEGQEEKYRFRQALAADIPLIMALHRQECARSLASAQRAEVDWQSELQGRSQENVNRLEFRVIETLEGRPVGYIAYPWYAWGSGQAVSQYELLPGISYLDVTPAVIRYLWEIGKVNAPRRGKELESFIFGMGSTHPVYDAAARYLVKKNPPYTFYMRVADLPAFLSHIAPALESRLAASVCSGHTGELKISFYRRGICLSFENGKIVSASAWNPVVKEDEGSAAFPGLTFLHLVFGYRSLDEICYLFPDCWASGDAAALLAALFPKKASHVWPVS